MLKMLCVLFSLLLCAACQAANHHPQEFLQSIKDSKDEGKQIVQHFCSNCHAVKPIIPLGAPRIGEENDWRPRVKSGLKTLFAHTAEGLNAMPARGGCFECSDEQLMLALLTMLPESLRNSLLMASKDHKINK